MAKPPESIQDFDKPYLSILSSLFKFTVFVAPGTLGLLVLNGSGDKIDTAAFAFFGPLLSMPLLGLGIIAYWTTVQLNKWLIRSILLSFWRLNMGYGTSKLEDLVHLLLVAPRPWAPGKPAEEHSEHLERYERATERYDYEMKYHFDGSDHASLVGGSFVGSVVSVAILLVVILTGQESSQLNSAVLVALVTCFGIMFCSSLLATVIQIRVDRYWAFGVCTVLAFSIVAITTSVGFLQLLPYVVQL